MSATQREPIVVVKRAWDEEANTQELVAYLQDDEGNRNKIINFIPIDDGTKGIEHLLMRTMQKFRDHVEEAELLDGVIFREFTKCLAGSTLRAWNHIINDPENGYHGDERTNAAFVEACNRLRNKVCGGENMGDTQIFWLSHRIKKPKDMTPRDFKNRFEEIVDCTRMLDGFFQQPNEHEIRTWFYNAFPTSYKKAFQKAGMKIDDQHIDEITEYFQNLHDYEKQYGELKDDDKKRKRSEQDNRDGPRTSNKKQRGRDRRWGRRDDHQDHRDNRKPKWNGKCPLHPDKSHTWGDCFSNPESKNFRPQYGNNNSRRDGGGGNRGSNRSNGGNKNGGRHERSDAHHYEDGGSSRSRNNNRDGGRNNSRGNRSSRDDDDGSVVSTHHMEHNEVAKWTNAVFEE